MVDLHQRAFAIMCHCLISHCLCQCYRGALTPLNWRESFWSVDKRQQPVPALCHGYTEHNIPVIFRQICPKFQFWSSQIRLRGQVK